MQNQRYYRLFGVNFASDRHLNLPEASPEDCMNFSLMHRERKLWPTHGAIIDRSDDKWVEVRVLDSGDMQIHWKNFLSLHIKYDGREVLYSLEGKYDFSSFDAYIANFAISGALLLQGTETLHATVLWHRERGIGLLGHSGAGKSTFSAYMLGQGAELVTDDMLRITEGNGALYAEPGQPRLKLYRHDAQLLLPSALNQGCWNPVSGKLLVETDGLQVVRKKRQLTALFCLAEPLPEDSGIVTIERVTGLDAFKLLASATMNSRLQTGERLRSQLKFAEWIGRRIPIFMLRYPRRYDIFPKALIQIDRAIDDLGTVHKN